MLALTTLARPYARAAFEVGRDADALADWSRRLQLASAIAGDDQVSRLVHDPMFRRDDLLKLFADVGGDQFDDAFRNFLKVLAYNRRLELLAEITAQFEHLRQSSEKRLEIEVISAVELDQAQREKLAEALKRRFGREVEIEARMDPAVLGGVVIRAGDHVIDGSVRGRLNRLSRQLAH